MLPALPLYSQLNGLNEPSGLAQAALAAQQAASLTNSNANGGSTNGNETSPGSRDTIYTKIFVGGLPYHTSDETLHNYFRHFGEIEEAVVITDRQTQKSRGYGFVTMKERADAEKACRDPNPIIDGRKANVNLAYLGAKPRNNAHLAALSTSLTQMPQLQAAQLQAALQLQQQQQRLGLAASVGTVPQLLFQNPSLASAIAAAQQQQALAQQQQQLAAAAAAVNPLAAFQLMSQAGQQQQQPQNAAAFAASFMAQQAALLQQHQQQQQQLANGTAAGMDYNQLLLAAAAQQQQQQRDHAAAAAGANATAAGAAASLAAAGYGQMDYSAAAYPLSAASNAAVTSVTNSQSYVTQLAAQAQLAAVTAGNVGNKRTRNNSDGR